MGVRYEGAPSQWRGIAARGIACVLACAWACAAGEASASPDDLLGIGTRSPAMGATGAASATGFEAVYANPALLSRMREQRLAIGLTGATFHLHARGANDERGRVSSEAAKGIVIGADVPLPFGGVLKDRLGAALAVYTPTQLTVRGRILYPEKPQFPLLPDRTQSIAVRIGVGADIGYGVRLGAGFATLAEFSGSVVARADNGAVCTKDSQEQAATYAPILGVTYEPALREKFRFGLAYRGTLDARFAVSIDARKLSTLSIPLFNIAGLAQYDPGQFALEAAHERAGRVLALGVTWKRWSAYPGQSEPTILCPPNEPDCGALKPASIGYSDTLAVHAGVEQRIELTPSLIAHARGGAFFEDSPLPTRLPASEAYDLTKRATIEVATRYYDAPRLGLTVGGGVRLGDPLPPLDLDFFAQYQLLVPTQIESVSARTGAVLDEAKVTGYVLAGGTRVGVRF